VRAFTNNYEKTNYTAEFVGYLRLFWYYALRSVVIMWQRTLTLNTATRTTITAAC